jgi:hypothetical protein
MHKHVLKTLVCVLCLQGFVSGNLLAEPSIQGSHLEIGPSISSITYEEPGVMEDKGTMYGIGASYTWHGEILGPIEMIKAEAALAWGSVDYTSENTGSINDIDDSLFETRLLIGTDLAGGGSSVITPFIGFGYRRLTDASGGLVSTTGHLGYDREANYYYSPVGFEITSDLDDGWSIGGAVEYDFFWDGTQKSYITDADNADFTYSNDLTNDQNDGYGLRASIRITKKVGDAYSIAFEPYFRYWDIDNSEPDEYIRTATATDEQLLYRAWEPKNSSTEYGLRVSLVF